MSPTFYAIWAIGVLLVLIQFIVSCLDGYGTRWQIRKYSVPSYAFVEHGGMWADVFIVSPVAAYILSEYRFRYYSFYSIAVAVVSAGVILRMLKEYRIWGLVTPEAHAHDGKITAAGWIHAAYAWPAMWSVVMFYTAPVQPPITRPVLENVTLVLAPWCILGPWKFSRHWKATATDLNQMAVVPALLVMAAAARAIWLSS